MNMVLEIANYIDQTEVRRAPTSRRCVRSAVVEEFEFVDEFPGVALPMHLIEQLGLAPGRSWRGESWKLYSPVVVTILGRDATTDAYLTSGDMVRLGRAPLLIMDLVVDPLGQKLIGNPAHDGVQTFELY